MTFDIGTKDKNGVNVKLGDRITYYRLYKDFSDAVDMFGVEPQNNFTVNEIFIEKCEGVVVYERCGFRVNGVILSDLGVDIKDDILEMRYMGHLDCGIKEWLSYEHERYAITSMKQLEGFEVI